MLLHPMGFGLKNNKQFDRKGVVMCERLFEFLQSKGFLLVDSGSSPYFGDYHKTFLNDDMVFRLVQDRSQKFIDIASKDDRDKFFDMAPIRQLFVNDPDYNAPSDLSVPPDDKFIELRDYFIENYDTIAHLFSTDNYETTKKQIQEIKRRRAELLYPGPASNQ